LGVLIGMVVIMIVIGFVANFMKGKKEAEQNKDKE
jgi:hypothetical protein